MAAHQAPLSLDSPGKNTGVGCHFLLQCMKVKSESEVAESSPTLSDPMDCGPPGSSSMGFSRQGYWSGVPSPSPSLVLLGFFSWARNRLLLVGTVESHCLVQGFAAYTPHNLSKFLNLRLVTFITWRRGVIHFVT